MSTHLFPAVCNFPLSMKGLWVNFDEDIFFLEFLSLSGGSFLQKQPRISALFCNGYQHFPQHTALMIFFCSYRHFTVVWSYFYILSSNISSSKYIKNAKNSRQVKTLDVSSCCELEGVLHIVLLRKVVTTQN